MGNCFYKNGLQFECQGCNYCCGCEPGYVFLSETDVKRMSDYLNISYQDFIDTYCRTVDMGAFKMVSLLEKPNYDCIFLCDKGCKVYGARPVQCSSYPFWEHVLENSSSWEEEASHCPGINKGKLFSLKEIEMALKERRVNNPIIIM